MPAWSIDEVDALREIAEVENALFDGYPIDPYQGSHQKGCIRIAAERLRINDQSLRRRVGSRHSPGAITIRYGFQVDWDMYRAPPEPEVIPPVETQSPPDPVKERRLQDEIERLRSDNRELLRRVAKAEDIRGDVLGLAELPPTPIRFPSRDKSSKSRETIVLLLSDLHWGERVDLAAMDGLNSYSVEIARTRLGRWTNAVCDLATQHWSGPAPDRIILILGGDLISGAIHNELAKTDELKPLPAVKDCAEHLAHAIKTIAEKVGCPVDVISLPGNHGRTTLKPESKEASLTSLDVLVSDFLELALRDRKGITFYAPLSPDALFSVYGWRVMATHGDRIGSRGGQGFVGPAATAARGFKKIAADYSARGVHLDLMLICHLHTPLQLEEGFVNGSLPGPTEYSRDGRFRPHPAMQLFLVVHPRHRVSQIRWIEVGHPDEGSLYEPPPTDRPLRPRFRVKTVTERV